METVSASPAQPRYARAVVVVALGIAVVLAVVAIGLGWRNRSFVRDPFIYLLVGGIATYAIVGGLLAYRVPRNPIGWLFLLVGVAFLLSGATSEYAVYALVTAAGTVPFGLLAGGWLADRTSVSTVLVVGVVFAFLLTAVIDLRGRETEPLAA